MAPHDVSLLVYNVPWSCKVFTLGQDERTFCNLSGILPKSFYNSDKTKCPKLGVRVPPDVSTSLLITDMRPWTRCSSLLKRSPQTIAEVQLDQPQGPIQLSHSAVHSRFRNTSLFRTDTCTITPAYQLPQLTRRRTGDQYGMVY